MDGARTETSEKVTLFAEHEPLRSRAEAVLSSAGAGVLEVHGVWEGFLEAVERAAPAASVVCWQRLGPEQVEKLARLRELLPDTPVVLVAASFARASLVTALSNDLAGFVREEDVDDCLPLAVDAARRGQMLLPRGIGKIAAEPALSVREKQILGLVVMGLSNAEIASTLFVTESTVKSHLSSAFARLGVRSRNQATALILDPERGFGAGILAISPDERRR